MHPLSGRVPGNPGLVLEEDAISLPWNMKLIGLDRTRDLEVLTAYSHCDLGEMIRGDDKERGFHCKLG